MTNEKIIEVEVTAEDLSQMRADGIAETDLPEIGVKKYRPARHILKDKVAILLDADIVEHFKKRTESQSSENYQMNINRTLRRLIENERAAE